MSDIPNDTSTRARNVLRPLKIPLKIKTVERLLNFPKAKLFKAEDFGGKRFAEVQLKLFEYLSGKGAAIPRSL